MSLLATKYASVSQLDFRGALQTIVGVRPDEIYNLAGQSSVGLSCYQPVETFDSIGLTMASIRRHSGLAVQSAGGSIELWRK